MKRTQLALFQDGDDLPLFTAAPDEHRPCSEVGDCTMYSGDELYDDETTSGPAPDFWTDADVISTYSRAQAIEDGVLIPTTDLVPDEPDFAKQAGWKIPVAITSELAALVVPFGHEVQNGQSVKGRLWDVLNMARIYGKSQGGDTAYFPCIFWLDGRRNPSKRTGQRTMHLKAVIGPGDDLEPVLTVMLRDES